LTAEYKSHRAEDRSHYPISVQFSLIDNAIVVLEAPTMSRRLHDLLRPYPSVQDILQVIQDDSDAVRQKDEYGSLPIHYACTSQCKPSVMSKLLELYPESLAVSDGQGNLPLHCVLAFIFAPTAIALMMVEKYPDAIRHRNAQRNLPIHIECSAQCRAIILSKCIELYPESLSLTGLLNNHPWSCALYGVNYETIRRQRKALFILLSARPESFYHPPHYPFINQLVVWKDSQCRRIIFNLLPCCLSSAAHLQDYRDLNWRPRSSLLYLCLQFRSSHHRSDATSLEQDLNFPVPPHELNTKFKSNIILLVKLMKRSCLVGSAIDASLGYGFHFGDDVGAVMLRFIISYL
jgi:ankyrin repeat protein